MKINGLIKKARWENIACCCGKKVIDSFPIKECLHCKFDQAWQSVPQKDFETNNNTVDKNGKVTKKQTRIVKEINLIRGDKFQDVIGWTF
jgi:hypothetical protein|tara:strand:+ start:793 stop:1062 length:270 start_codon:yes stop_codon:yes gene_type:complete